MVDKIIVKNKIKTKDIRDISIIYRENNRKTKDMGDNSITNSEKL